MEIKSKYIVGLIFIGLGVLAYYFIGNLTDIPILSFLVDVGGIVVGGILAIVGAFIMLMGQESMKWLVAMAGMGILSVVLWVVPDPIPFIDELGTSLLTLFFAYKSVSPDGNDKKLGIF